MGRWDDYTEALRDAGAFIAGEGLQESATATTVRIGDGGERVVTDGPFAETKEQVGGFYLIECEDLDEALEWAKKIPARGGAIEVRPVMDYDASGGRGAAAPRRPPRSGDQGVVDRLFREESGRAVATLIRVLGDFDPAEEAVQEAFVVALERWPRRRRAGQPGRLDHPGRPQRAIDRLRRERTLAAKRPSSRRWRRCGRPGEARTLRTERRRRRFPTTGCG